LFREVPGARPGKQRLPDRFAGEMVVDTVRAKEEDVARFQGHLERRRDQRFARTQRPREAVGLLGLHVIRGERLEFACTENINP
jgi:hypothetical protein